MKRLLATLLTAAMVISTAVTGAVPAAAADKAKADDPAEKYVTLDGEWHFKNYRTYAQMYQYFAYMPQLAAGTWTDTEAAAQPDAETWKSWDTVQMPFDNPEMGGLLSHDLAPKWSESWVVREFDVPENFTEEDEVTLLLGIIDDIDVVYINGEAVAASGFVNGSGEKIIDVPELGGFNYDKAAAPEDQVKFGGSFWNIKREYKIPADAIKQGETNEIAIRLYNNNDYGGFYSGNVYALCGNDLAVRALKGLPTEEVECDEVINAVAEQRLAIITHDIDAYAATIAKDYHNDDANKEDRVAEIEELMVYEEMSIEDINPKVYKDDDGYYWYSSEQRIITSGDEIVFSEPIEICYQVKRGVAQERGNWNRCYQTSYRSELFGQELKYGVYLPESYYEEPDKTYPVVWLLHGMNSSSEAFLNVDKIGAFMDKLIDDDDVVEMVVIMPDSGKTAGYRDSEYTGDKESSGPWATQLNVELRGVVQDLYRVYKSAEFNGVTGISMGGGGALSLGTKHSDLYSSVGVHMGAVSGAIEDLKALSKKQLREYDFYIDCGLQDTRVGTAGTIAVHEYLESMNKKHGYDLRDGGHNSAFYMEGMDDSMTMHSDHFKRNGLYELEDKFVELDGEWNFKLYRRYGQMFQYFAYMPALVNGTWTDAEAAVLPDTDTWKSWPALEMPADDESTGGLLSNELSPTWSEAWVVREFDLPENFTSEDEVTLLMGIIDDMDVVYINGELVAASGFVDGNGEPTLNIPETGGFVYDKAVAAEDQVKFGKSYWEIQREYKIPADVLNLGGTNEIAVRLYNNNSFGGFYSDNLYALCGNEIAERGLKGLPTELVDSPLVEKAIDDQIEALEARDIDDYARTIAGNYHNDDMDKKGKVAEIEALMEAYYDIGVDDENAAVYEDDNGNHWYAAYRVMTGMNKETGKFETIFEGDYEVCFEVGKREANELGNWNRCYPASYESELFGETLTYSVYLPESYYENSKTYYPVVWLLHGRASSSTSYRDVDDIGAFMDDLIASGEVTDMVVIMPDSGKYAFYSDSELVPGDKDNTGPWATQLTQELRGVIADKYRVLTDAEFNGLTGNSMGGYGSMVLGTSNPDLYSSIGVHMGYLPGDALDSLKTLSAEQLEDYDFYLDCGLQDGTVGPGGTIAVHEYLVSVGKDHGYDLRDGDHNSAFYMSGMDDSMTMHSEHFLANGVLKAGKPASSDSSSSSDKDDVDVPSKPDPVEPDPVDPVEPAPSVTVESFDDLKKDEWYAEAVDFVLAENMMVGVSDSEFAPYVKVTAGMVAQILWSNEDKPAVDFELTFEDVAADAWYTEAIRWAASEKIVSGSSATSFGPAKDVTREQLAVMLYNYAKFKGVDVSVGEETNILSYGDAFEISQWAIPALQWACGEGIISGTDGMLNPAGTATRVEAAQMLMKFCELL